MRAGRAGPGCAPAIHPRSWLPKDIQKGASLRSSVAALLLLHFPPQTQRTHVRPDLFDVLEAFGLRAGLPRVPPAGRDLAVDRPDRVLLFIVHDDAQLSVLPIRTLFAHCRSLPTNDLRRHAPRAS